jgi:hypothetical protein
MTGDNLQAIDPAQFFGPDQRLNRLGKKGLRERNWRGTLHGLEPSDHSIAVIGMTERAAKKAFERVIAGVDFSRG